MKKRNVILSVIIIIILILLVINPQKYIASVSRGILTFALSVLPALLPFFILTKVLTDLGAANSLYRYFTKPMKKLYKLPPVSAYIFLLSMMSGYPVGAKLTADFHDRGYLDDDQSRRLSAFCSTSGPFFIIGTVGQALLQNKMAGYAIFFAHILASLLCGLIVSIGSKNKNAKLCVVLPQKPLNLSETVYDSIISILMVGGFICVSFMLIDMLIETSIIKLVTIPMTFLFNLIGIGDFALPFSLGLFEVTRGAIEISQLNQSLITSAVLCCSLISFSGLCIILQCMTFLSKAKVKAKNYLLYKFLHLLLSIPICYVFCLLLL